MARMLAVWAVSILTSQAKREMRGCGERGHRRAECPKAAASVELEEENVLAQSLDSVWMIGEIYKENVEPKSDDREKPKKKHSPSKGCREQCFGDRRH